MSVTDFIQSMSTGHAERFDAIEWTLEQHGKRVAEIEKMLTRQAGRLSSFNREAGSDS